MDLDKKWHWRQRKLECRVRPETGNPQGDDLRERLASLAGVNLADIMDEMKKDKKQKETINKGVYINYEDDRKMKEVLRRSHVVGASKYALTSLLKAEKHERERKGRKNINKVFTVQPKSPPRRVLMDVLRERAKPLIIPNKEESKEKAAKLEKKLAKQRAARKAAINEEGSGENASNKDTHHVQNIDELRETVKGVFPEYQGDLFGSSGNYLQGMLYLSRMLDDAAKAKTLNTFDKSDTVGDNLLEEVKPTDEEALIDASIAKGGSLESGPGFSSTSIEEDKNAKLFCAAALCDWARIPANAERLVAEGAIRAVQVLAAETDARIQMFCSGAFRFMSEQPSLANAMIDEGTICVIGEMVSALSVTSDTEMEKFSEFISFNLVISLVNLSRCAGKEAAMVEDSIVVAVMNLMQYKSTLSSACARCIYNLTCVDVNYPQFERVVRALISMSTQNSPSIKHICAAAICNFADLKMARPRMIDEGVISTLSNLARGSETRTRRVCAVVLQNLSSSKACRVEMTSRHCVQVAYALSSDQDPIILRCISLTLARLALEAQNCLKIITDGGIMALCNIAVKFPGIPGISQPTSSAFQLLSSRENLSQTIVQEGSVAAVGALLKMSTDQMSLRNSLLSMCFLNSNPDNHVPILQQGIVPILQSLCSNDDPNVKNLCALAFLNLSLNKESHRPFIQAGAVPSVIVLAKSSDTNTKCRCAYTLFNLCSYELGVVRMVADGLIDALVELCRCEDQDAVRYAIAALCRITVNTDNAELITASGAVEQIVGESIDENGSTLTKKFCAAALCALSVYESCRTSLCDRGIIPALKALSYSNDDDTKHRCLVAFGNLSCEDIVQPMLVEHGLVPILAELANSYHEADQRCCAKTICNLACHESSRYRIASDGGMSALMMISLVRSYDLSTKIICIRALNNLLDDSTLVMLLNEGIVGAIANLCRITGPADSAEGTARADSTAVKLSSELFSRMSSNEEGKFKITEKSSTLVALYNMIDSPDLDTQIAVVRSTCNLLMNPIVAPKALDAGAVRVLDRGIQLGDDGTVEHALGAIFCIVSGTGKYRVLLARSQVPQTLLSVVSKLGSGVKYDLCIKILAIMAWYDDSRIFLQNTRTVTTVANVILSDSFDAAGGNNHFEAGSQLLCYLLLGYPNLPELSGIQLPRVFAKISDGVLTVKDNLSIAKVTGAALRILTSDAVLVNEFVDSSIATIIHSLIVNPENSYDLACAVYNICTLSVQTLLTFANDSNKAVEVINYLGKVSKNCDLISCTICVLASNPKTRSTFAIPPVIDVIPTLLSSTYFEETKYNTMSALYHFSKIVECRNLITECGVEDLVVNLIGQPSTKGDLKINTNRALKAIQSDSGGAIEEGVIANLIAVSIDGKPRDEVADDLRINPELIEALIESSNAVENAGVGTKIPENKLLGPPSCADEAGDVQASLPDWSADKELLMGGNAGKGPSFPETHSPRDGLCTEPVCVTEEMLDGGDSSSEGKAKMSFAKMNLPSDLKGAYVLTDEDFDSLKEEVEAEQRAKEDAKALAAAASIEGINNEDVIVSESQLAESSQVAGDVDGLRPGLTDLSMPDSNIVVDLDADVGINNDMRTNNGNVNVNVDARANNVEEVDYAEPPLDMAAESAKLGLYK